MINRYNIKLECAFDIKCFFIFTSKIRIAIGPTNKDFVGPFLCFELIEFTLILPLVLIYVLTIKVCVQLL